MTVRKLIGQVHLWLGLASGLVVFVLGITGCILVFEQEIRFLTNTSREARTVPIGNAPAARPSAVFQNARRVLSGGGTSLYYLGGKRPNQVLVGWYYVPNRNPKEEGRWTALTINPYTGQVMSQEPWSEDFWGLVTRLHTHLLLPRDVGGPITGYATVIFLIMLLTGLILWYPKSRKGYTQRFTVKWRANPKRLNYDLHNVLGFYVTWIVIFTAFTGLMFSFEWVRNSVFYVASGGETLNLAGHAQSVAPTNWKSFPVARQEQLIDSVTSRTLTAYPVRNGYMVNYPLDSTARIDVSVMTERGRSYDRHDEFSFDRYTGRLIGQERWSDQNAGERIVHLIYPIHVGSIGGLPTKLLAFFGSLIAASLPVTGFLIWWGRRKKNRRKDGPRASSYRGNGRQNRKARPITTVRSTVSQTASNAGPSGHQS